MVQGTNLLNVSVRSLASQDLPLPVSHTRCKTHITHMTPTGDVRCAWLPYWMEKTQGLALTQRSDCRSRRHGRRLGEQLKPASKGKESRLEQLLTPPPVLREDFVSPKLATKLAQQLKVGILTSQAVA